MARHDPNNISDYWLDPDMSGLSLMRADFTTQEFSPHYHDAFVVAVTEAGGAKVKSRGVVEQADRSALLVFNPSEPHAGWMGGSRRWRYRSFYLEERAIAAIIRGLGIEHVPHFTGNKFEDRDLIRSFLSLHHELETSTDRFRVEQNLLDCFGQLFARHGSGGGPVWDGPVDGVLLKRAVAFMRDHKAEALELGDIASAVGLSSFQLIRLFKKASGLTPHAFLVQLRLHAACGALRRGVPIAEAASVAGFYDQSALTRHFKRCYGMTPLQFSHAAAQRAAQS